MTLEHFREFCTTVRFGNITKAADYLYISQPTLSRHIADLENGLGVQLLVRDNRVFMLTEAGRFFYKKATVILEEIEQLETSLQMYGRGNGGRLSFSSPYLNVPPLYDFLRGFHERFPDIQFDWQHYEAPMLLESLLGDYADIAFGYSFMLPQNDDNISIHPLFRDRFCAVLPPYSPNVDADSVSLSLMDFGQFIDLDGRDYEFTENLMLHMRNYSFGKPATRRARNIETLTMQIRMGLGFGLLPLSACLEYAFGCAVLPIVDVDTEFDFVAFWLNSNSNQAMSRFTTDLKKLYFPPAVDYNDLKKIFSARTPADVDWPHP